MTYLRTLRLQNFRNYQDETLEFSPHINFFVGKNGEGKTNCLEAIALMISGKSFRTPYLKELIQHSQKSFFIQSHFVKNDIEQSLSIYYSPEKKQILHNATTYPSFLPLIGLVQGVFFAGFQDELIKGSPQIRRRFLDLQNAQIDPLYLHHLKHFQKALKERNFLLKQKAFQTLPIFEELMSKSIPYIIAKRLSTLHEIETNLQKIHQELSSLQDVVNLQYKSPFLLPQNTLPDIDFCNQLFAKNRTKDQLVKHTQLGPHKDEVGVYLKGESAKKFASEGQIQTVLMAIYLAEYFRLEKKIGQPPLFCLDDLGQNLDPSRLNRLLLQIESMGQVFITLPEMPNYHFSKPVKIFRIENGSAKLC